MTPVKSGGLIGLVFGVLFLCLLTLIFITRRQLQQDRTDLSNRFSEERLRLLLDAAELVESDIQDIASDLMLAAKLTEAVSAADSPKNVLEAVLSLGKAYQCAALFDAEGRQTLFLTDPRRGGPPEEVVSPVASSLAGEVMREADTSIHISELLTLGDQWLRVFAVRLSARPENPSPGVLALVVDMQAYLAPFTQLSAEAQTHLLVLGPRGDSAPISSAVFRKITTGDRRRWTTIPSVLGEVLRRMEAAQTGDFQIDKHESERIGLGSANVTAVFTPIRLDMDQYWSAATFTSMAVLEDQEQSLLFRLATVSIPIALFLMLLSVYVFVSSRNRAILKERVRYLDEVAHLNEKARKILDSIPVGAVVLAADGRATDMNRELVIRRNRSPLNAPSDFSRIETIFGPATDVSTDGVYRLIQKAKITRTPSSLVSHKVSLFGNEGYFTIHAVPIDPPTRESDLLLVIEDLSEVKRLEARMLSTEKLAAVGVLSAGIAHEIGTPLGVVRGRAEFMLTKTAPGDASVKGLQIIVEQIDRVVRIINHLLDFARPKPVMVAPSDPALVIRKCTDFLRIEAGRRKLTLRVASADSLPRIIADPDLLEQVFINLIMNAFDACAEGGVVTVAARQTTTSILEMEISDTGCGIAPEDLQRVFDPFFSTKKRGKSTGLGLSTVSQIVRSHHAEIQLSSVQGEGTTVTVHWPVAVSQGDV